MEFKLDLNLGSIKRYQPFALCGSSGDNFVNSFFINVVFK